MKKIIAFLLALMTLLLAVSCGTSGQTDDTTAQADTTAATPDEPVDTTPANERDTLPDVMFTGEDYTILSRKNTAYEIEADAITGDLVNDAVYERNATVSQRFGVNIKVVTQPGEWTDRATFVEHVGNVYMSGSAAYDLIMTHSAYIVDIGTSGYAYDINDLGEIDLSKRWWCPEYTNNVNINDMIFSAVGDLTYSLYERLQCMFFNKQIVSDKNAPDIYALVQNNEWTFDKFKEIVIAVGEDLNGDSKYDENDLYGLGINNHTCRLFQTTFDTQMTVKGPDGRQIINLPNEKYTTVFTDVYQFVKNNTQVRWDNDADKQVPLFMNNKLMIFAGRLGNAVTMKDMTNEYGIVPFPKYDANQARYISGARDYMTAMAVFAKLSNPRKTAVVTEALCMYGFQKITPAYYETSLKYKYMSDPVAVGMLDLIRDNLTFDFAMTFTAQINTFFSIMGDNIQNGDPSIAGFCKSKATIWGKSLDKIYESYDALK